LGGGAEPTPLAVLPVIRHNFGWGWTLLVIALYCLYAGLTLPDQCLHHWDEFLTIERTERMGSSGDWTQVKNNAQLVMQKPPLHYSLGALVLKTGVSVEIGLRLWSLFFTAGTLLVSALLADRLGERKAAWTPLVAVLFCLSSTFLVELSVTAMLDAGYAFFIVLSLYAVRRAVEDEEWWIVWGVAAGLGAVQKNPMALFASLWVILILHFVQRTSPASLFGLPLFRGGLLIALIPIGCWTALQNLRDHVAYRRLYVSELLLRNTVGLGVDQSQQSIANFDWLEWVARDGLVLWSVAVLVTWYFGAKHGPRRFGFCLAVLSFVLFILAVFTFAGGPFYDRYLITVTPLLAAVTAGQLGRLEIPTPWPLLLALLAVGTNGATIATLPFQGRDRMNPALVRSSREFSALLQSDERPVFLDSQRQSSLVSAYAKLDRPILFIKERLPADGEDLLLLAEQRELPTLFADGENFQVVRRLGPYTFIRIGSNREGS